jgi:hypothetical protein
MADVIFSHRQLLILALGAVVACHAQQASSLPAPAAPAETIAQFLAAANATDLDKMAALWGDEHGPNHKGSQNVRTQQLTIMQRLLHGDAHEVVATDVTNPARPQLSVAITRGTRRFTVPFTLVRWRHGGWLINGIDLAQAMPSAGTTPN